MLGVEAVAERMADHVVGHHPTMPGAGKAAQAVVATRRLENSLHASIMTIVLLSLQDDGRGEFSDFGHWTGTQHAGHQNLPAGHWVYVYPKWYIWRNKVK